MAIRKGNSHTILALRTSIHNNVYTYVFALLFCTNFNSQPIESSDKRTYVGHATATWLSLNIFDDFCEARC